jgi:signal transduction histidine kinase
VSLPAVVAVAVSHGTREALTNVIRHAEVDAAAIAVYRDGETVAIEVSDEGKGFDPRRTPEHRYGVTRSLIARMARLGGRASVLSRPGAGTLVRMEWPDERS